MNYSKKTNDIKNISYLMIIFHSIVRAWLRCFENILQVARQIRNGSFALFILQEGQYNNGKLNDQYQHTEEYSKVAQSLFPIIISTPHSSPVDDPDQINQSWESNQIPHSDFLIGEVVIPQCKYKEEEWQVVVRSLKISQHWENDNGDE